LKKTTKKGEETLEIEEKTPSSSLCDSDLGEKWPDLVVGGGGLGVSRV
jgi:hypothetical protein